MKYAALNSSYGVAKLRGTGSVASHLIVIWCFGDGCCVGCCVEVAEDGVVFVPGPALPCAHQHASCHSSRVSAHVLNSMLYCTQGSHRSYDLEKEYNITSKIKVTMLEAVARSPEEFW